VNSPFTSTALRALAAIACCLVLLVVPFAGSSDCRAAAKPTKCGCCEDPQAGCCAAKQQKGEWPAPVALQKTTTLREVAPAPATIVAVLPPFGTSEFRNPAIRAVEHRPRVARHSFLCIRTV
jgi:hypothetical protein